MQPRACLYICVFVYIYIYLYICDDVYIYASIIYSICSSFSISPGKTKNHFKHILAPLQKPIVTNYQYLAELEKFVNYTRLSKNIMDCVVVGTDVQVPRIIEEPWPIWKTKMLLWGCPTNWKAHEKNRYFSKFMFSHEFPLTDVKPPFLETSRYS